MCLKLAEPISMCVSYGEWISASIMHGFQMTPAGVFQSEADHMFGTSLAKSEGDDCRGRHLRELGDVDLVST